ncbi:MAG: tetratricopeptide repeat protein [Spirochaetota bacterium]
MHNDIRMYKIVNAKLIRLFCTIIMLIIGNDSNTFAIRRDEVLAIPRGEVIKASVDYIGMTDLLATINTLYLNGYYSFMNKHIDEYTKKYPPVKEIFYFAAINNINQNKPDDALNNLYIALALEPAYSRALNAIGYVYAVRRQWQQALSHFLLAHRTNTYNAFISYNIALLYYHNLDYVHAAAWANKAIDDKPNFARGCDVYACSMYQQQKYDEAVEYWGRALQLGLDEDRVYYNRASAYFALSNHNGCIADCTKALQKNKKHVEALMLLAYEHFTLKDYDAALAACNSVLKIQNNNIFAAVLRALCAGKKNAQAGKDMLTATLGTVENVEDVAMQLLQFFQYAIIDPPVDFMLY